MSWGWNGGRSRGRLRWLWRNVGRIRPRQPKAPQDWGSREEQGQDGREREGKHIPEIIRKKRDGETLQQEEIRYFVRTLGSGRSREGQIGAMLMAIRLRGMEPSETMVLTQEIAASGTTLDWPAQWRGLLVDKHSTGGVGTKSACPWPLLWPPVAARCVKTARCHLDGSHLALLPAGHESWFSQGLNVGKSRFLLFLLIFSITALLFYLQYKS
uniref:Glycosyl transferase family 3 N-terminal domain-containing protein n=1 Tax=Naja naja TaxID=35670 RepID=A0A8C6XJ70_NAJNA